MIFGKYINRYYLRHAPTLLLGIAALILVDYMQLIIPELYRMLINGVNSGQVLVGGAPTAFTKQVLMQNICLPMIGIIVSMVIGRFLWRICFFGAAIRVETELRNRMFDHSKELSQSYYQVNKVGNLMSLYTNDLETVQECFGWGVMELCDALFLGVMSMYKMFEMDWKLTLFSLIPMSFMLAMGIIVGKYITKKWDARQEAFSELSDFAQESFSGIAVIKAFVKEFKELLAFRKLNKKNEKANVEYTRLSVLLNVCVTLFVESVICVILGYGGYLVYVKAFDASELMEFIGYFNAIVWPIMAITDLIDMTSRGKASVMRVSQLLDTENEVADSPTAKDVDSVRGDVEFRHLTFRHPDAEYDALSDVSFKINAGESIGVIGKTGCGKTTVADLILRCYNVPRGCLFVDGKDVNDITISGLRRFCAYVPQDNYLFGDTIANNIAFASDNADMPSIIRSAQLADVDDNISGFSMGYDTLLGEQGVTVSGGQKQRISIARALLKDAPILILDDSVSAVDTDTEKVILGNLRENRKGKTTILIAHRVSTVKDMDKVLYMDNGKVVGFGTHEQLEQTCPDYKHMVELQKLEEEKEGQK